MAPARARHRRIPAQISVGGYAQYDSARGARTGVPEVILAEGKSDAHLVGLLRGLATLGHGALISRISLRQERTLRREQRAGLPLRFLADGRLGRLEGPLAASVTGRVGVLTAGTADVPLAEEAVGLLRELGVEVVTSYDVGVAGIHRLQAALRRLERRRPQVYLVFAGREGALPTVVAGLVRAPVVGVPTSVGYGRGGRGEAALLAMLQSCAPIAVVNIDGAIPAALFALQVLAGGERRRGPPSGGPKGTPF